MPIAAPNLDDRKFQDIVDELKKRIPLYCPGWTDHNVSDPGVALIELFAYVAEQMIYRMNQVPDLHYMKFAQFLGVPIPTPQPAHGPITFRLTKAWDETEDPSGKGKLIPAGTEVSTTQTEHIKPIILTTLEDAKIYPPRLCGLEAPNSEKTFILNDLLKGVGGGQIFSDRPRKEDGLYFDFSNDIGGHVLKFTFDFSTDDDDNAAATGIDIENPPLEWVAYSDQHRWVRIRDEDVEDGTKGFNTQGSVILHVPNLRAYKPRPEETSPNESATLSEQAIYRIGVRVSGKGYARSPILKKIGGVAALGRTVDAYHVRQVENELLGRSDGSPGQRFRLGYRPVVLPGSVQRRTDDVSFLTPKISVIEDTNPHKKKEWEYTENFKFPEDEMEKMERHFTIDVLTNEVRFAPALQLANSEVISYGAVPPRDAQICMECYSYGSELIDLPYGSVNILKSSIDYVDRVENRSAIIGGRNALSRDAMSMEVQRYLRLYQSGGNQRAVTEEDYATLVLKAFPDEVAKVYCKPALDGTNTLYIFVLKPFPDQMLEPTPEYEGVIVADTLITKIDEELHEIRLLTQRPVARNPQFVYQHVTVKITNNSTLSSDKKIKNDIYRYLHPVTGGIDERGWSLVENLEDEQAELRTDFHKRRTQKELKGWLNSLDYGDKNVTVSVEWEKVENPNKDMNEASPYYLPIPGTINVEPA